MNGRNPNKGRHFQGAPIGKSGTQPKPRTGSPSGNFVGTGVNAKSAASPEHTPSNASGNTMSGKQLDSINSQAPEPFRNPRPGAKLTLGSPQQSGGPNKAYQPYRGSRVSVPDGDHPSTAASVSNSADKNTSFPRGNSSAVGISGSRGRGSENGKVAGLAQPRKKGNPFQQPKAQHSFYGR